MRLLKPVKGQSRLGMTNHGSDGGGLRRGEWRGSVGEASTSCWYSYWCNIRDLERWTTRGIYVRANDGEMGWEVEDAMTCIGPG